MLYSDELKIYFTDQEHLAFYESTLSTVNPDVYRKALVYTLGICPDTRNNFNSLYDIHDRSIIPQSITAAWQTSSSLRVTRLAFNLFTDGVPTVYLDFDDSEKDKCISECSLYSVSDIFCDSYAFYFFEAIKIRYPEYFRNVSWAK